MNELDISPIPRMRQHVLFHPDRVAVVYEGRSISYGELWEIVGGLAAGLRADGVGPGDRVAYLGLNSATFLIVYLASAWLGAAFVPINFRLAAPEIAAQLLDARPHVLVCEPDHVRTVGSTIDDAGIRRALVVDDDHAIGDPGPVGGRWERFSAFRTAHDAGAPAVPLDFDHLAALLYTSGTTGRPKGVMLTHGNLWWNSVNVDSVVDTRTADVYLAVAPLFHIGGLNTFTLRAFTRGSTVVVRRAFNAAGALEDLERYRINGLFAAPAMLAMIAREPGFAAADLSALRSTIIAGAPVPPAVIEQYANKHVLLQQAWGLTETAPFSTYLEASMTDAKIGSAGIPMPFTEVQVTDIATATAIREPMVRGELWVRGPNVAVGYWNNPEATAAAFTDQGWFRTGDIGYVDDDGYLFIVDRLKDMVITGGENVYPAEVERILDADPRFSDTAVVGTPDEQWGEAVVAVVSLVEGATVTLEQLREFASPYLARYKLPTRLLVVDTVPRNGAGKLDKLLIRRMVEQAALQRA